jgi:putative glutamine amidotransferase
LKCGFPFAETDLNDTGCGGNAQIDMLSVMTEHCQVFMERKPLIGISMRLEIETDRFYLARHYSEAVIASGGIPVHIPLTEDATLLGDLASRIDGLLLPGSDSDVDPLIYGEEPHPKLGRVIPVKEATDLLLLEYAEARKIPIFGICFGMQALNVFRGGTLFQDIESQFEEPVRHQQGSPRDRESHSISIEHDSILARLAGTAETVVNSHHHQAVKSVGNRLRTTARARDGVIEAIEGSNTEHFVIGVQWHPELSWRTNDLSKSLFNEFVRASSLKI